MFHLNHAACLTPVRANPEVKVAEQGEERRGEGPTQEEKHGGGETLEHEA